MENIHDESPNIPSYEDFKRHLVEALNSSSTNWSKKPKDKNENSPPSSILPSETQVIALNNIQPYGSRIYQRRHASRKVRLNPYTRST